MSDQATQNPPADTKKPATQKPSVGRAVHFYTNATEKRQPYPATITHVWEDGSVNLDVSRDGSFPLTPAERTPIRVPLGPVPAPGDDHGAAPCYWTWPPYVK